MNQNPVAGFEGEGLVNTYLGGDDPHGKLTSPAFTIERRWISFLIGGGRHPDRACLNLVVDGEVVRTETGRSTERLTARTGTWPTCGEGPRTSRSSTRSRATGAT